MKLDFSAFVVQFWTFAFGNFREGINTVANLWAFHLPADNTIRLLLSFKRMSPNKTATKTHAHTHTARERETKALTLLGLKPLSPVYVWSPPCLSLTWYLPRTSSPLPSLSQICLHSKEMHCTVEPSKETTVRLLKALGFKHKVHIASGTGRLRIRAVWQVMRGILLNPWETIWAPPPPLLPMFQWLGPWPLRQGKICKSSSWSLGYMFSVGGQFL